MKGGPGQAVGSCVSSSGCPAGSGGCPGTGSGLPLPRVLRTGPERWGKGWSATPYGPVNSYLLQGLSDEQKVSTRTNLAQPARKVLTDGVKVLRKAGALGVQWLSPNSFIFLWLIQANHEPWAQGWC